MPHSSRHDRYVRLGPWPRGLNNVIDPVVVPEGNHRWGGLHELIDAENIVIDVDGAVTKRGPVQPLLSPQTSDSTDIIILSWHALGEIAVVGYLEAASPYPSDWLSQSIKFTSYRQPSFTSDGTYAATWGDVAANKLNTVTVTQTDTNGLSRPSGARVGNNLYLCYRGAVVRCDSAGRLLVCPPNVQNTWTYNREGETLSGDLASTTWSGSFPKSDVLAPFTTPSGDTVMLSASHNVVRWSGNLNADMDRGPQDWRSSNFLFVGEQAGDRITAMVAYQDQVVVFKQRSIWVLAGDPANFRAIPISGNLGVDHMGSVVVTPNGVMFFDISGRSLWLYAGGGQFADVFENRINIDPPPATVSVVHNKATAVYQQARNMFGQVAYFDDKVYLSVWGNKTYVLDVATGAIYITNLQFTVLKNYEHNGWRMLVGGINNCGTFARGQMVVVEDRSVVNTAAGNHAKTLTGDQFYSAPSGTLTTKSVVPFVSKATTRFARPGAAGQDWRWRQVFLDIERKIGAAVKVKLAWTLNLIRRSNPSGLAGGTEEREWPAVAINDEPTVLAERFRGPERISPQMGFGFEITAGSPHIHGITAIYWQSGR